MTKTASDRPFNFPCPPTPPFPACSQGLNLVASRNEDALVSTLKSVSHLSDKWIFIDRLWDTERKERDCLSSRQ